jgi:hypothetical protein
LQTDAAFVGRRGRTHPARWLLFLRSPRHGEHTSTSSMEYYPYLSARHDTSSLNAFSVVGYHDEITAWLKANVTAAASKSRRHD